MYSILSIKEYEMILHYGFITSLISKDSEYSFIIDLFGRQKPHMLVHSSNGLRSLGGTEGGDPGTQFSSVCQVGGRGPTA